MDHILGKLRDGLGDGALVRLSTPLIGVDRDATRGMLIGLAREIERALGGVWPTEEPARPETPR